MAKYLIDTIVFFTGAIEHADFVFHGTVINFIQLFNEKTALPRTTYPWDGKANACDARR